MPIKVQPHAYFDRLDGCQLGLSINRFDERQRRLRLRLSKVASCWDYAPLIDVVLREPGFAANRFLGKTAAQLVAELSNCRAPEHDRFVKWYESVINKHLSALARRPRVPDNHYCIELATPPLESSLPGLMRRLGLKRASVEQWSATLKAQTGKGLKSEELEESGVLTRLQKLPTGDMLTLAQVLEMVDLAHVKPKLACESRFGFVATAGWYEGCRRIPEKEFKRRGLLGRGYGAWHIIRFRHQSLGWSIVRTRYSDLVTERADWWSVLDDKGRFVQQPVYGFDSPEDAMEFAELQMSQRYASWGRDQELSKWERFSLPGGDGYREILVQLDDWPENYQPRHYRTRNVLVHIRTSIRKTQDGRRVLFLDEVQSDWHADLHTKAKADPQKPQETPPPDAPFRKEWPLLSLKLMVWWAQRLGLHGVAWSTAELQLARWRGYGPPETLYRSVLPEAARALATTLGLAHDVTSLSVRTYSRRVDLGNQGWEVRGRDGVSITKPFRTRAQAESFADQTGAFVTIEVPVIWIKGMAPIRSIPLYGTGTAEMWLKPNVTSMREQGGANAAV